MGLAQRLPVMVEDEHRPRRSAEDRPSLGLCLEGQVDRAGLGTRCGEQAASRSGSARSIRASRKPRRSPGVNLEGLDGRAAARAAPVRS